MRSVILAALGAFAFATSVSGHAPTRASAPLVCAKGYPCGDACIPRTQVCHATPPPVCKPGKSKPCGRICIPLRETCLTPG